MFHLVKAGDCQLPRALCLLSAIYLQRPHNELEELSVTVSMFPLSTYILYCNCEYSCFIQFCLLPSSLPLISLHYYFPSLYISSQPSAENECKGRSYLLQAAEAGVRTAMIEVAREYEREGLVTSADTPASKK